MKAPGSANLRSGRSKTILAPMLSAASSAMRVLHISDVHVDVPLADVPWSDWLGKRMLGGGNHVLRRSAHFRNTRAKLAALDRFRREQAIDLVICTGDYTVLGTRPELVAAREAIEPLTKAPSGFVTVPGNHDVYVADALGRFEAEFNDLLTTDLPEHRVDGAWPIVRLIGDAVAVVAVNSARPNNPLWRSSGAIPAAQLAALGRILRDPRVRSRFVFVITHYAPRLADGRPDTYAHGLVNADDFLAVCADIQYGAILHGHVHRCFSVRVPGVKPSLFGAGSTTQDHREGLWLFDLSATEVRAVRGGWDGQGYVLTKDEVRTAWSRSFLAAG
jgi:3',5'-cyclic AMP phosphodiesterase CpdA